MNSSGDRVGSLRELPQSITPPRDLWPGIAQAIAAPRDRARSTTRVLGSLAASLALVAVGILLGRGMQPAAVSQPALVQSSPAYLQAALRANPRFARTRDELRREAAERLLAMSPAARAKVTASMVTLQRSLVEIESAIGRQPANALLQDLLVDTYQEEMRVLATVAGNRQEL